MKDERILALISLQSIVTEKYDLIRNHEAVPARLDELEGKIAEARENMEKIAAAAKEDETLVRRSKRELDNQEDKLSEIQAKLNQVKTTREYESRQKEIQAHRARTTELEEVIAGAESRAGLQEEQVASAERAYTEISERFSQEIADLKEKDAQFEAVLEKVEARENESRSAIPAEILERVQKLFLLRGGVGVVPINDGCCGGCGIHVSPQTVQLAKRGLDLIQCDRCSSYLYWDDDEEE